MKTRTLTKAEVAAAPYEVWNAFVNILAQEPYSELAPEQRPAHLVFWYESEVQNGGHLQYFENRPGEHLDETIDALGALGATEQQTTLQLAARLWRSKPRVPIQTAQEFCDTALEGEFSELDSRFHACSPSLVECLQSHLACNESDYVLIE